MPLLWPTLPHFVNDAERRVWSALHDQLGDNDLLIANQRFIDRQRDYEIDIVVVFENGGVVVLEIKGGTVWNDQGQWWQKHVDGDKKIEPV
ncbi:MAG: nuclease-related domain-containing protein, partial [Aeromicrobium sp.]